MTEYHKINALFMRDMDKPNKPLIEGQWASPEFGYLADNRWEFTEKVDGTNIRIELTRLGDSYSASHKGRTNNASIPTPLLLWLEEWFPDMPDWRRDITQPAFHGRRKVVNDWMQDNNLDKVVLYGEGYGPKIQSGGNYRDDQSFVLFDVKIGDFWLTRDNVDDIARKLGIDSVPTIGYGTLWDAIAMVKHTPSYGGLKSTWNLSTAPFEAEGIVARPVVPLFNRQGNRVIAKIKARDFR